MKPDYSKHINETAREWFTLMQSGQVSDEQHQQLAHWLAQDEQHQRAYSDYQKIWNELATLSQTAEGRQLRKSSQRVSRFGQFCSDLLHWFTAPTGMAALASIALLAVAFLTMQPHSTEPKRYTAGTAEIATIVLEDGSEITLSAQTTIKAWFTKSERHVALVNGQAYFKIAKNPQRPFWVDIDNTLVRVVGTEFDIQKNIDKVKVAVAEGVVNVFSTPLDARDKFSAALQIQPTTLTKGQQVEDIQHQGLTGINAVKISELAAWRQGKLVYRAEKLKNVVRDANRYSRRPVVIEDSLAEQEVTAVISINNIDKLPETLAQLLPITIEQHEQDIYLTAKK